MELATFFDLSYGMFVLSTLDGTRTTGCIVNTVVQVTDQPPVLAVSVNHDNYTNTCLKASRRAAVAILDESTPMETIGAFGFRSGKDADKFQSMTTIQTPGGMTLPSEHICGWLDGKVIGETELSTHTVFFLSVEDAERTGGGAVPPMTYSYYHKVKRGAVPKNAPHYTAANAEADGEKKWTCKVCGYIYDGSGGPFESLPEDWKCPLCGAPKSEFELR